MAISGTKFRKTKKICVVCGKEFEGTDAAQSCGAACRVKLSRLKAANKRPEFMLMAKGRGQKIPDLNAPKGVKLEKGQTLKQILPLANQQKEVVFDVTIEEMTIEDAKAKYSELLPTTATPLTMEQKFTLKEQWEAEIKEWEKKPCQGHPRQWRLKVNDAVAEIRGKINQLFK